MDIFVANMKSVHIVMLDPNDQIKEIKMDKNIAHWASLLFERKRPKINEKMFSGFAWIWTENQNSRYTDH